MKSKFLFLSFICFVLFFSSCKDKIQTQVSITVKSNSGEIQSDVLVYEFEYPATESFGNNPMYANKSRLTNKNGIADFSIDGFEFKNGSSEASLYFTVLEKTETDYIVKGTVNVKIKDGEVVSETLNIGL